MARDDLSEMGCSIVTSVSGVISCSHWGIVDGDVEEDRPTLAIYQGAQLLNDLYPMQSGYRIGLMNLTTHADAQHRHES